MASQDADDKPPAPNPETAPDPDEDDLDDLDEMLDEFSAAAISSPPTTSAAPGASGPGRPGANPADGPAAAASAATPSVLTASDEPGPPPKDAEDFAEQLQAGMAQMLQDLESNPEMAKQFEEMMAQFGAPPPPPPAAAPTSAQTASQTTASAGTSNSASSAPKTSDDAFQDTIRRTMDRMKASSTSADAAATSAPSPFEDDMMASLLRELQSSTGGDGAGEDESFSKMLLGMMEQLTNKDILYEPMKELDTKFPGWLEEKGSSLPAEDKERYETQRGLVREIVQRFERTGYKDENPDDREFIVERMQKMQAAGAPPPDLVGDVDAANEMVAGLDQGCPQQ